MTRNSINLDKLFDLMLQNLNYQQLSQVLAHDDLRTRWEQDFPDREDFVDVVRNVVTTYEREDRLEYLFNQLKMNFPQYPWGLASSVSANSMVNLKRSGGPALIPFVSMNSFIEILKKVQQIARPYEPQASTSMQLEITPTARAILDYYSSHPDLRRTAYWTIAAEMSLRLKYTDLTRLIPGFIEFAVGFMDPDTEEDAFGVIIYATWANGGTLTRPPLPKLEVPDNVYHGGKVVLPVIVRSVEIEEHSLPSIHPNLGTAACWARSRIGSKKRGPGILISKHIIGVLTSVWKPVTITLAEGGQPGDSGALIRDVTDGKPGLAVGLYAGVFKDPADRIAGHAQHLHQVVQLMDMELYE